MTYLSKYFPKYLEVAERKQRYKVVVSRSDTRSSSGAVHTSWSSGAVRTSWSLGAMVFAAVEEDCKGYIRKTSKVANPLEQVDSLRLMLMKLDEKLAT